MSHQAARRPRGQLVVSADHGRHPAHAGDAGQRARSGARDHGVRVRPAAASRERAAGAASAAGRHLAGTARAQGLGLRRARADERAGRQRRRAHARHHRPRQQGPAAGPRRLGRAAGVGVGRQPRARLFRDRPHGGCQTRRHRRSVALRQGRARRDGLRPAVRHRLHRVVGRGRGEAASPPFRRAGGERRRLQASITGWRGTT